MNYTRPKVLVQKHNPVDLLLQRLDKVTAKGKAKWAALCPAHNDKTPSLSIKETEDGILLLKCWAGCSALDVVQSVGLELKDLFPRQIAHHHKQKPYHDRLNANYRDLFKRLHGDLTIVEISASDVIRGDFSQADMPALTGATGRLRKLLGESNV